MGKQKHKGTANLKPFVKGDPRINRKGRPKSFDELRSLAQDLFHKELPSGDTIAESLLKYCAASKEPALIRLLFEYAYGKVPDKIETNAPTSLIIMRHAHERNGNGRDDVAEAARRATEDR